ncbi:MAG: 50S ribosomal protein L25 [Planctomycetes bacterium]|nr:50S ribosomal protein L25 [Planctomycetota bacterium]
MAETEIVKSRAQIGGRNNRRLRDTGWIPAVIYGGGEPNANVAVDVARFTRMLRGGARAADLEVEGRPIKVLFKQLQYNSLGDEIIHIDFQRLKAGERIRVKVPLELVGDAAGAREGGVIHQTVKEVPVACLPEAIPEKITVLIADLGFNQEWRLGQIPLPAGVLLADPGDAERAYVSCRKVKEEAAPEPTPTDFAAEPEVITEKKEEAGEEKDKDKEKEKKEKDKEKEKKE